MHRPVYTILPCRHPANCAPRLTFRFAAQRLCSTRHASQCRAAIAIACERHWPGMAALYVRPLRLCAAASNSCGTIIAGRSGSPAAHSMHLSLIHCRSQRARRTACRSGRLFQIPSSRSTAITRQTLRGLRTRRSLSRLRGESCGGFYRESLAWGFALFITARLSDEICYPTMKPWPNQAGFRQCRVSASGKIEHCRPGVPEPDRWPDPGCTLELAIFTACRSASFGDS